MLRPPRAEKIAPASDSRRQVFARTMPLRLTLASLGAAARKRGLPAVRPTDLAAHIAVKSLPPSAQSAFE